MKAALTKLAHVCELGRESSLFMLVQFFVCFCLHVIGLVGWGQTTGPHSSSPRPLAEELVDEDASVRCDGWKGTGGGHRNCVNGAEPSWETPNAAEMLSRMVSMPAERKTMRVITIKMIKYHSWVIYKPSGCQVYFNVCGGVQLKQFKTHFLVQIWPNFTSQTVVNWCWNDE